jgi:small subunit ribosomal protein S6
MNKYELLLILPGTLDEREAEVASAAIVDMVKEISPEVERQVLGKSRLAYPIKQIRYGYFYTLTFTAEGLKIVELQNKLRLHREVLRFMVSHFGTDLTAEQKAVFAPSASVGSQSVVEQPVSVEEASVPQSKKPKTESKTASAEDKKVDMEEVKKKLDKILNDTETIAGV